MLVDDPRDVFLRYSLSLELEKEGRHEESLQGLRGLMSDEPPYVAAFFMAAQHLVKQRRIDEARTALREGIEEARRQGNAHAAGEMAEMLAGLGALGGA
jgi:thioredoxin-like negative regulator of GroEL